MTFIGRVSELKELQALKHKKSASLCVISGRRRIGKSRLAEEFGKTYTYYSFSGIPPSKGTTAELQRKAFAIQLEKYVHIPLRYDSWYELLHFFAQHIKAQNCVVLLDEISWMGSEDPEFLGILKTVWDQCFKQNEQLVLILCGSVSHWITKNILSHTGFIGRISLHIKLKELSLKESSMFWNYPNSNASAFEILKVLACVGGIPRYLEEINPKETAEENIRRLCFKPSGVLFSEFNQIFSDLFDKRASFYKTILEALVDGAKERNEIAEALNLPPNGALTEYLDHLIEAGFIQRDFAWGFLSKNISKQSKYRLSDNYLRFYLKYIEKQRNSIERGLFESIHLSQMSGWNSIMGLQFENLVLNNRKAILTALGIEPSCVVNDGPYFQKKTLRKSGCQIDYLIQTRLNELYIGEIKFSMSEIKPSVIEDVKLKHSQLTLPKHFSIRPFLVHVNGVSDTITESEYFSKCVDIKSLLCS
jgi:AAA+ ATPase superfamily predicted ATPase